LREFQPRMVRDMAGWLDKCFFLSFAMAVMGFVTAFEWGSLFPDSRDYVVLTPLPIRVRTTPAAKNEPLIAFFVAQSGGSRGSRQLRRNGATP